MCSWDSTGRVKVGSEVLWVQLLVWKAGPSFMEAVSMLISLFVGETSLERQSAALFFVPLDPLKGDIVGSKF